MTKLRPQDLAAIGQLYLNPGQWDGEQVVSSEWVEEATTAHVEVRESGMTGYGYMWWITDIADQPAYLAVGLGGQVIHVVPAEDIVLAVATEFDDSDLPGWPRCSAVRPPSAWSRTSSSPSSATRERSRSRCPGRPAARTDGCTRVLRADGGKHR